MTRALMFLVATPLLVSLSLDVPALTSPSAGSAELETPLYRYVLSGAYEASGSPAVNEAALIPAVRARLRDFRARVKRVKSRLVPPKGGIDPDGKDGFRSRRSMERAIVALFDTPGIEQEAAGFARKAIVSWEYEGYPDGALAEAAYAEAFLTRRPQTPAAPYLHLYLAHRYRVAFETHGFKKNPAGQKAAARRYRACLARARASSDPLILAAADDLDRQPVVYMELADPAPHPRTFGRERD